MDRTSFVYLHPYRFVALVLALMGAVYATMSVLSGGMVETLLLYGGANLVLAVAALLLLTLLGLWHSTGLRLPYRARDLVLFWVPLLPVLFYFWGGTAFPAPDELGRLVLLAALVAFVQETYFRGLLLVPLTRLGVRRGALIASGLAAVFSLLVSGTSNSSLLLLEFAYAVALGLMYCGLALRTGTIWPLILLHALTNVGILISQSTVLTTLGQVVVVVYAVLFAGYGLYLLSPGQMREAEIQTLSLQHG